MLLAAGGLHTCVRTADDAILCWGGNALGQLGVTTDAGVGVPGLVIGPPDAISLCAGEDHSCAVDSNGDVWCWGSNAEGQLGGVDGSTNVPMLAGVPNATKQVACGSNHTCAVVEVSGLCDRVWCWGDNGSDQTGAGPNPESAAFATAVTGTARDPTALALGSMHSCALWAGEVHCWGANNTGQLGRTTTEMTQARPGSVDGIVGASAISAGSLHNCALVDEAVWCWGDNGDGQLGRITSDLGEQQTAAPVADLTAMALAAGPRHTCALRSDGSVACWGNNMQGQLGDGTVDTAPHPTPVPVTAVTGVTALTAGGVVLMSAHTCAGSASTLWCWGANGDGQLGDGSTANSALPVEVMLPP
jgi:alpha-tubulin suppressor-like RCC1 family protein